MFLITVALSVGFRRAGDMGDFAATMAGSVLFVIALPTSWVLSFSFIDVTRFTVLIFGVATSFPLWYLVGAAIARSTESWLVWVRRYLIGVVAWTAINLILIAAVAAVAS